MLSQTVFGDQIEIVVAAFDDAPLTQPVPYRLRIDFDAPDVRCPRLTTTPSYVEAHDGASNAANDVYLNDDSAFAFTVSSADAPEPTSLTVASGDQYRISGSSADVPLHGNYFDADTYAIHTGPTTDELTIRADWTGGTSDFDFLLARAASESLLAGGTDTDDAREYRTFAVMPDTTYWLWIAPYKTATNLPTSYDLSLCGDTFTFGAE